MLTLENVDIFYGAAQVLHEVSFSIAPGEVVALAGRNGAGKSTTLKTMAGFLTPVSGRLTLDGHPVSALTPERMNREGIAYVPEDRQIFPTLTVEENLAIATIVRRTGPNLWTKAQVLELFPRLAERRTAYGQSLSGGEQQMLAIGRALLTGPRILLLDEPTEGLAPIIITAIVEAFREIVANGVGMVFVEQNFRVPESLSDRFVILDSGRVEWSGDRTEFANNREEVTRLLSDLGRAQA
ncbi:MAG: ABC transporter ATP-binding protein [Alphaproteobacteria bacterium]|nr:ABC transporter ATP-binding protein [Alphaproteobacteria bacterium]